MMFMKRVFLATGLIVSSAFAQDAPLPSFEVASVRMVNGLPSALSLRPQRAGGRVTWSPTLHFLVEYAYDLPAWRISGVPLDMTFYAIAATIEPSSTEVQVRLMFRRLLAERFGLQAHSETRQSSGYSLVVARNGPKLTTKTAGSSPPMPEYLRGRAPEAFEGRILSSLEGPATAITGRGVPMTALAKMLSEQVNAFVVDRTGLQGDYYFGFLFSRQEPFPADSTVPSLTTALQDELGLRLEKEAGPLETLVVTKINRIPAEN